MEREPVAAVVRREDRPFLILRERRPFDAAFPWGRIGRAGSPWSLPRRTAHSENPLRIEMFFARVRADWSPHCSSTNSSRRSVPTGGSKSVELEVAEVAGELVEAGLVRLVRVREQPAAALAQVRACLLAERKRPVRLVLHGVTLDRAAS